LRRKKLSCNPKSFVEKMEIEKFIAETRSVFGQQMVEEVRNRCGGVIHSVTEAAECRTQIQHEWSNAAAEQALSNTEYGCLVIPGDHFRVFPDILEEVENERNPEAKLTDGAVVENFLIDRSR